MQNNLLNHLLKWTFTLKWAKGDAGWWVKTGICSHLLMLTRVLTGFSERTRSTCCRKKWDWTVAARLRLDLCEGLLRQVKKKKGGGGYRWMWGRRERGCRGWTSGYEHCHIITGPRAAHYTHCPVKSFPSLHPLLCLLLPPLPFRSQYCPICPRPVPTQPLWDS